MSQIRGYRGRRGNKWLRMFLAAFLVGVLAFSALFGAVMHGSRDHVTGEPEVMIVLGCQVKPWGPSILLQDRLEKAWDYWQEHPEIVIVVSGGQGPDEPTTEALAMHNYLVARGVPAEQIYQEDRSHNTVQNLRYSREVLKDVGLEEKIDGVIVVSNGFHLTRVRMIFSQIWEGEYTLSTLAAPSSHLPSRLKMYIREPLALVKSFVFDR